MKISLPGLWLSALSRAQAVAVAPVAPANLDDRSGRFASFPARFEHSLP